MCDIRNFANELGLSIGSDLRELRLSDKAPKVSQVTFSLPFSPPTYKTYMFLSYDLDVHIQWDLKKRVVRTQQTMKWTTLQGDWLFFHMTEVIRVNVNWIKISCALFGLRHIFWLIHKIRQQNSSFWLAENVAHEVFTWLPIRPPSVCTMKWHDLFDRVDISQYFLGDQKMPWTQINF